jgi:hypothetical protein
MNIEWEVSVIVGVRIAVYCSGPYCSMISKFMSSLFYMTPATYIVLKYRYLVTLFLAGEYNPIL